jgi:hypothetical protein
MHRIFSRVVSTTAAYSTLTRPFSITRLGSDQQQGKSTTDQLFALRQILEKCNEFNITTHHLFIDFKSAYDTMIRNEVYVGKSELNFPTKLIRLTKTTLTIVTCCGQHTKRLFQILWNPTRIKTGRRIIYAAFQCRAGSYRTTSKPTNNRHNLQQKNTKLLAYADDIDIVGMSQSAVQTYLALEGEAAKVGLKINERRQHDVAWKLATNILKSSKKVCI